MSYENNAMNLSSGTAYNHYGPRGTEDGVVSGGEVHGAGGTTFEKVVYITGDDFAGGLTFDTMLTIPAGAIFKNAAFEVTEVFVLGNADNVINIGTNGSEATNGVELANPDVLGTTIDIVGAGTWQDNVTIAADTAVGVAASGTTASVAAGSGKAKVVLTYQKL